MTEKEIAKLLEGVGRIQFAVKIPKSLYEMIRECGFKKYGALPGRGSMCLYILYFVARGVIDWEEKNKK